MVELESLELSASCVQNRRSPELSYSPIKSQLPNRNWLSTTKLVRLEGLEPPPPKGLVPKTSVAAVTPQAQNVSRGSPTRSHCRAIGLRYIALEGNSNASPYCHKKVVGTVRFELTSFLLPKQAA